MSKPSVAVFGINGALGDSTITAFSSPTFTEKFSLPILAVTRDASQKTSDEVVKYVQGDLQNAPDALAATLTGVDVVVSLVGASPANFAGLEQILASIKPEVYIPSQFGIDIPAASSVFPGLLGIKEKHSENARQLGIKVVDISTSLFAGGHWLRRVIGQVGGNVEEKSVRYLGSPESQFSYTTITDIGKVVASVAFKAFNSPADFPNHLNVQSGFLTPQEVIQTYEKENEVSFTVKEIVPKELVLEEAKTIWAKGFNPNKFLYYLNVLISQGQGSGIKFVNNDNDIVNPGESLWEWAKF